MRWLVGLWIALGLVGVGLRPPGATSARSGGDAPGQRVTACGGLIVSSVTTDTLRLCDELEVAVTIQPFCPVCPGGTNVVYIQIDQAPEADWMNAVATMSLGELEKFKDVFDLQVGVIHYNSRQVRVAQEMTDDLDRVRNALRRPSQGYDPHGDFVAAARRAVQMLQSARRERGSTEEPCEFIVFFPYIKYHESTYAAALREAGRILRGQDVTLMVGCPIQRGSWYCRVEEEIPSSQKYFTEPFDRGKLPAMVRDEMRNFTRSTLTLNRMGLTQRLPSGLQYRAGSANPPPAAVSEQGGDTLLEWSWERSAITLLESYTVTYRVQPVRAGDWLVTGRLDLTDNRSMKKEVVAPEHAVTVLDDTCVPSPTPPPPPPTDTPVPPTATPVPTNTPTPTATPKPRPIYLPIIISERCDLQWIYSDVVLVLDISTSMNRLTRNGRTKLAATQDAAKEFVAWMDFTPNADGQNDQVAVVGFNRTAWIEQELTNDRPAIELALDDLEKGQAEYTRLDLALERGAEALRPELRQAANTPVIILLTDGLPNRVPPAEDGRMETTVLRAAQKAKDADVRIYTIAIGEPSDTNPELLAACATVPSMFFYTPDPEDLGLIYTQIAYSFGCPKDSLWGGR
jgi:Mg-chelatase subunit ChlD